MAIDLTTLERAAARAGRVGLTARLVPHDRRRGDWFRVQGRELLVSEQLVERCPPEDAAALCMNEMFRLKRLARVRTSLLILAVWSVSFPTLWHGLLNVDAGRPFIDLSGWRWAFFPGVALGFLAVWVYNRAKASLAADDETVERLGDATPLVRGLNFMDQDELRIAGRRLSARPDLHKRAERLVAKHRLCAPPELR